MGQSYKMKKNNSTKLSNKLSHKLFLKTGLHLSLKPQIPNNTNNRAKNDFIRIPKLKLSPFSLISRQQPPNLKVKGK